MLKDKLFFDIPYDRDVYIVFLSDFTLGRYVFLAPFAVVAIVVGLLWQHIDTSFLLLWGGLLYVLNVFRILSLPSSVELIDKGNVRDYLLRFTWVTLAYASALGIGVAFFIFYVPLTLQVILSFILISTSFAMLFLVVCRLSILFFVGMNLPAAISLFALHEQLSVSLGFAEIVAVLVLIYLGRIFFFRYATSIGMRYENNQLIRELRSEVAEHQRTGLKLEQSRLQAEQANEAKSEFLSLMSHELRTPIHGIMGTLDLLSEARLNQEHQENLILAKQAAQSLRAVVNDVLDLSKLNAGKMEVRCQLFSIEKLLDGVMRNFSMRAKSKGLDFYYKIQHVPEKVFADDIHLRQVLLNIIANAVKFTESGHVAVLLSRSPTRLMIEVEDTGIGIPEEELDSIFDPFKQVHQHAHGLSEGTGLGTSIAQRFVTLLGGDIHVRSKLGEGSKFCIDIPCEFQGEDVCCEVNELHPNGVVAGK
ncbi:MAG: ATP-binding protein [Mariprofundaceae bacterium]|nr:ATP-binding protein [Mariprofundaceae bacterium]